MNIQSLTKKVLLPLMTLFVSQSAFAISDEFFTYIMNKQRKTTLPCILEGTPSESSPKVTLLAVPSRIDQIFNNYGYLRADGNYDDPIVSKIYSINTMNAGVVGSVELASTDAKVVCTTDNVAPDGLDWIRRKSSLCYADHKAKDGSLLRLIYRRKRVANAPGQKDYYNTGFHVEEEIRTEKYKLSGGKWVVGQKHICGSGLNYALKAGIKK